MKTKRFLSVLLVMCALVCIAALTATSAFAATEIRTVTVFNIPKLLDGDPVSTDAILAFGGWETPDGYYENDSCWDSAKTVMRWTKDGSVATSYAPGDKIVLEVHLELADGYSFSNDLFVHVNGEVDTYSITGNCIDLTWEYVEQIAISHENNVSAPVAVPGEAAEGNGEWVELLKDTSNHFQISGRWLVFDYAAGKDVPFSGTFEDGRIYTYEICAKGTDYYQLSYCDATVNHEYVEWRKTAEGECTYKLSYPFVQNFVDYVQISPIPEAVIGETAADFELEVFTENVTATGSWKVLNTATDEWIPFTGTFEDGKVYSAVVTLRPAEGFVFAPDGEIMIETDHDHYSVWAEQSVTEATFSVEYSFRPQVDRIEINGVTGAAIGETATLEGITVPSDALYHIGDVEWQVYTQHQYEDPDGIHYYYSFEKYTGAFEDGKKYQLYGYVDLDKDYEFAQNAPIFVNGEKVGQVWSNNNRAYFDVSFSFQKVLDKIEVTMPESVIGQPIYGELTAGENTTAEATWYDDNYNYIQEDAEAVFEDGKRYYLSLHITPAFGYEFSEDAVLYINGTEHEEWYNVEDEYCNADKEVSFVKPIEQADITGVKDAVIGEKATVNGIKVPENVPYKVSEAYWFCDGDKIEEGTVFEDGKRYILVIRLAANEGYEFNIDSVITVNGEEFSNYYADRDNATIELEYSFKTLIEKVEITLTEPVIGATADLDSIKAPESAPYKIFIDNTAIFDVDTMEPFEGKYEDGHKYLFLITVLAEEGYECEYRKTAVFVNGEEVDPYEIGSDGAMIFVEYSFKKAIDKVELSDIPEAVVGETAEEVELTVPENAPYTATGTWMVYADYGYEPFEGKFQSGKVYRLMINIVAKEGYDLSEDTAITANGTPFTGSVDSATFGLSLDAYLNFAPGLKVIDKIEITLPELVVGNQLPAIKDITLPEGIGCTLEYLDWSSSKTDDAYAYTRAKGVITDGLYYAARIEFYAEEGHVFADKVTLVINGEAHTYTPDFDYIMPEYASFNIFRGKVCDHAAGDHEHNGAAHWTVCTKCGEKLSEGSHVYTNDQDASCNTCGYERQLDDPDPIPDTGDTFAPVVILMALVSLAAVVVLNKRRTF